MCKTLLTLALVFWSTLAAADPIRLQQLHPIDPTRFWIDVASGTPVELLDAPLSLWVPLSGPVESLSFTWTWAGQTQVSEAFQIGIADVVVWGLSLKPRYHPNVFSVLVLGDGAPIASGEWNARMVTPEPGTLALLGTGLVAALIRKRRTHAP